MRHRIARIAGPPLLLLLELLLPASGCRRRRRRPATKPAAPARTAGATTPHADMAALRGEDNALVRLYVLAHRPREEARQRTLRFAVHGVDLGPRVLHGAAAVR
ncbi:hypothetical protein AB0D60_06240 [Streptomyces sp. NPDC048306]|uniref:hypothetical protein n=1 Tax=Streptomyces sp. NPDC048306 TaxID=3154502 RepID=UPI0033E9E304